MCDHTLRMTFYDSMKKRIAVVSLCLWCALMLQAQRLGVESFRMEVTDLTANTAEYIVLDQNGEKCALIKVETPYQGFSFTAGSLGVRKVEQKVGEIWVYVPAGVKRLTISHQELGVLRNYNLGQTLKRAKTYVMKLKTPEKKAAPPTTQKVTIDYSPAHAMVLIDSKPYAGSGHVEAQLSIGTHSYIIAAEGYETIEGSFKLTPSAPRMLHEQLLTTDGKLVPLADSTRQTDKPGNAEPVASAATAATEASPSKAPDRKTFTVKGVSFDMMFVEGGTFLMGAVPEQQNPEDDEKPIHQVTLTSYYMGETEVTQALWQAVMGENPSNFQGISLPVEQVSWKDCQRFISRLQDETGLAFRLPTEAEWEYAARGGNKSRSFQYSGSNSLSDVAWYADNSNSSTHEVKTKEANELGIYDMNGNVWEWCQDWYGAYGAGIQTNPTGPQTGTYRVYRGGGWGGNAKDFRLTDREYYESDFRDFVLGFRLVLLP